MTTPADIVRRARNLISDPEHWCQGSWAKDKNGSNLRFCDDDAVSFCAAGALGRAGSEAGCDTFLPHEIYDTLDRVIGRGGSLTAFNDDHTHAEVIALFDQTIELLT